MFEVGNVNAGTTTLGTWLSSSVETDEYCTFAEDQFQPILEIETIPPLPDMTFCHNMTGHFAFFDTEGLDYQTELGDNYDIVTVLPHTLIAENVFLVVRDRLNPNEIKELIDRLAEAAKKTQGTFTFRNGKLFGNLIIVVNKCQVWDLILNFIQVFLSIQKLFVTVFIMIQLTLDKSLTRHFNIGRSCIGIVNEQ